MKALLKIAFGLTSLVGAIAQAGEPQQITLEQARTRAMEGNLALSQARSAYEASRWAMRAAVSRMLPKVNLSAAYTRFDDQFVQRQNLMRDVIIEQYHISPNDFPPFAYLNQFSTSLSISQPIYNGGLEITGLQVASSLRQQAQSSLEMQRRQTALDVETAYYNLCRAQQALTLQENLLKASQEYAERFSRRRDLGLAADVDVLRWQLQAASDETALVEARNRLKLAQLGLARAIGDSAQQADYYPADLEVLNTIQPDSGLIAAEGNSLWAAARRESPDLVMIQSTVDLAHENSIAALANFQPKINFNYSYSWQTNSTIELDGFNDWTAGISLSFPLFASFGNVAAYQEARVNARKAEQAQSDFELGLYTQLTAAHDELEAAAARLKSASLMQERAAEVLKLQEKRGELGMTTNLDLLDARNAMLQAQLLLINARFDALIAQAKVRRITG